MVRRLKSEGQGTKQSSLSIKSTSKKAQAAFEFMALMTMLTMVLVVGTLLATRFITDSSRESQIIIAEQQLTQINDELVLATRVSNGYIRTFEVPATIEGRNSSVAFEGGRLVIRTETIEVDRATVNVTGQIQTGTNIITKQEGRVCLNTQTCP